MGTDETSWATSSSTCGIGWFKGEGGLELWPVASGEALDREGEDNIGGVGAELSWGWTPLM